MNSFLILMSVIASSHLFSPPANADVVLFDQVVIYSTGPGLGIGTLPLPSEESPAVVDIVALDSVTYENPTLAIAKDGSLYLPNLPLYSKGNVKDLKKNNHWQMVF